MFDILITHRMHFREDSCDKSRNLVAVQMSVDIMYDSSLGGGNFCGFLNPPTTSHVASDCSYTYCISCRHVQNQSWGL